MNYRKERKFIIPKDLSKESELYFRDHPLRFKNLYPKRAINSLYFDDYNFSSYIDSSAGNPFRTKYRLRWYGNSNESNNGDISLEIKKKEWKCRN